MPLLLALAAAVYFVDLGGTAIWDANEAFYVETPREMLEAHDLVNPSFNYEPRFNKPVLSYWIVGALYRVAGVSVGVERFGIALGAMLIIGCAYLLARIVGGRAAGLIAATGLAADPRLLMFSRRIFIDIWLTAFLSLTLMFFAMAERYPERRRTFLPLMYVSLGLGVLTKGPVAIALPGLAFALYLIATRGLRRIGEMMIPLGALIVALIVVPWYAALYHQHGWEQIKAFLISENLDRYTSGLGVRQPRGVWYYLPVVVSDSFPWSLLLLAAAVAWKERTRTETLLWCWIAAIVGFFSLSAGKQDLYILPIAAAVAALGSLALDRGLREARAGLWVAWTLATTGGLLAIAGAAVLVIFEMAGRVYVLNGALLVGALGLIGGLLALGLGAARRPAGAALAVLATVIAVNWMFVLRVLPAFERYKPVPAFSRVLLSRLRPDDLVADYKIAIPSMVFYLQRHVEEIFDEPRLLTEILGPTPMYVVLSADDYADLAPKMASRTCIIDRRSTFEVKLKTVLARQPLPELLLITNECR